MPNANILSLKLYLVKLFCNALDTILTRMLNYGANVRPKMSNIKNINFKIS